MSQKHPEEITSVEELRTLYKDPAESVALKSIDIIDEGGAQLIAASPFIVLATSSENGLDCSPKGGDRGFVHVLDEKTLLLPDWSGNNRLDGLQNIIADPRVGLVFFFPGRDEVFRVNGTARLSTAPALTSRFEERGKPPKVVIVITVAEAYVHCGRAIKFGRLWDQDAHIGADAVPSLMDVFLAHVEYAKSKQENQSDN